MPARPHRRSPDGRSSCSGAASCPAWPEPRRDYNSGMDEPIRRRELFGAAASGLAGLAAACGPSGGRTEIVQTPDRKVLQWERDDLLVLVSGLRDSYRLGQEIRFKVLLNNQTPKFGLYRLRTKLAGRGQQ